MRRNSWRERAALAGVPPRARKFLLWLEANGQNTPGYWQPFESAAREFDIGDVDGKFTKFEFALYRNPDHVLGGVVVVLATPGILILDAADGRPKSGFLWESLCRFDVKQDSTWQVVGLSWYDGHVDVRERLTNGEPLRQAEMSGGFMYMHASATFFQMVRVAKDDLGVPAFMHRTPPLV